MTSKEFTDYLDSFSMKYLWTELPDKDIYIKFPQSNHLLGFKVNLSLIEKLENIEDIWYNLFYLAQESGREYEQKRLKNSLGLF